MGKVILDSMEQQVAAAVEVSSSSLAYGDTEFSEDQQIKKKYINKVMLDFQSTNIVILSSKYFERKTLEDKIFQACRG